MPWLAGAMFFLSWAQCVLTQDRLAWPSQPKRGQGVGKQLILATIASAARKGLRPIELTVHSENHVAQALYKSVGFEYEGTQRRGWCLDGAYFDVHHMWRISDATGHSTGSPHMALDQSLVDAAISLALSRHPTGYAGAAGVRTETGRVITSVSFDPPNTGAGLCHEAGAYCEANRIDERVVASVCVSRSDPEGPFLILAPCGICQERLALWGKDVEVAVSVPGKPGEWQSKRLFEVSPHYWRNAVEDAGE